MRARKTAGFAFSADPITLEAERRRIMYNTARYDHDPHTQHEHHSTSSFLIRLERLSLSVPAWLRVFHASCVAHH